VSRALAGRPAAGRVAVVREAGAWHVRRGDGLAWQPWDSASTHQDALVLAAGLAAMLHEAPC
jgi:hypothetical protein